MLIIDAEARICEHCYAGDLVPVVAIKGSHRKVKLRRIDCKCTHCGIRIKGNWGVEIIESCLDKIDEGISRLRQIGRYGEYDRVINDTSSRVTDSLLSDNNENSPYLYQQLRFINHLLDYAQQEQEEEATLQRT